MTSDLETRLRAALEDSAMEIQPGPPPAGLSASVRRRRTYRAAAAGTGALGVLGAVTIAVTSLGSVPFTGDQAASGGLRWTGSFKEMPAAPLAARRDPAGVWTGTEMLVWGGFSGNQAAETFYADGAAFDPATDAWRTLPAAPLSARSDAQAAWTGTEMIVWGGTDAAHSDKGVTDGAAYNPRTGAWRRIADAPGDRSGGEALVAGDKLVVYGGSGTTGSSAATNTLIYDLTADRWTTVKTPGRVVAAAVDGPAVLLAEQSDDGLRIGRLGADGTSLTGVAQPPASGPVDRVALVMAGDTAWLLTTGETGESRLFAADTAGGLLAGSAWEQVTLRSDEVRAPHQISTGYRGLTVSLPDDAVLLGGPPSLTVLDPRSGKVLLSGSMFDSAGICGISGALVWTGAEVLSWGGQTCDPQGPTVTAAGVRWTPVAR